MSNNPVADLFIEHPLLAEHARNDATVYAWFKQAEMGRCTIQEALIGALVWVADEKKKYFDEIIELKVKYEKPQN